MDRLIFIDDTAAEAVYVKMLLAFGNMERAAALSYVRGNILGETLSVK